MAQTAPWARPQPEEQAPWARPAQSVPDTTTSEGAGLPQENAAQRYIDALTRIEPFNARPGVFGHLMTGLGNIGGGVLSPLGLVAHPVSSLKSLANTASESGFGTDLYPDTPSIPMGLAHSAIKNPIGTAENLLGAVEGGEAGTALMDVPPLANLREGMKSAGGRIFDRTAGSTATDFRHGAQPGRGYLEGGGTPAFSLRSLGRKANMVADQAGENLGTAHAAADKTGFRFPVDDVLDRVAGPPAKLRNLTEGFGGTGTPAAVNAYEERLLPPLIEAEERGGLQPSEVWNLRKNLARNTRWNDPSMYDINAMRQESVGSLGGMVSDQFPEMRPLNRVYQGARNLADRATARAETGSTSLTRIAGEAGKVFLGNSIGGPGTAMLSLVPDLPLVKSGAGYGLFQAGKMLPILPRPLFLLGTGTGTTQRIDEK